MKNVIKSLGFAALLVISSCGLNEPAFTQTPPTCLTPYVIRVQAAHYNKGGVRITELAHFSNVTSPTGIHMDEMVIFSFTDFNHMLVAFDKDAEGKLCQVGYQEIDDEMLGELLNALQPRADQPA